MTSHGLYGHLPSSPCFLNPFAPFLEAVQVSFDMYYVIMFFGRFLKAEGRRQAHPEINSRPDNSADADCGPPPLALGNLKVPGVLGVRALDIIGSTHAYGLL